MREVSNSFRRLIARLRVIGRMPVPRNLREQYYHQQEQRLVALARLFFLLTPIVYLMFSFWDFIVQPDVAERALYTRLIGVIPMAIIAGLSQQKNAPGYLRELTLIFIVCAISALAAVSSLSVSGIIWSLPVFAMFPILVGAFSPRRWHLLVCVLSCLIIPLSGLFLRDVERIVWINYALYLVIATMFTLILQFSAEKSRRAQFMLEIQLKQDAHTDTLTGMLTRRRFYELARPLLEKAASRKVPVSILFADLDHFKSINDRLGHEAGDLVLHDTADALRMMMGPDDLLGRFGGEEFVALLPGVGAEDAKRVAARMLVAVSGRQALGTPLSISIGVSTVGAGESLKNVLRRADSALLEAKRLGRGRYSVATPTLDALPTLESVASFGTT